MNDEAERLAVLTQYIIPDSDGQSAYDDIVRLAAFICETEISAISIVDRDKQWFTASFGIELTDTARDIAFCNYTIQSGDLTIVTDAHNDPRFAINPLVTGQPGIRFYAGAPLITESGHALGSLCVIDRSPKVLSAEQQTALQMLARQVVAKMELTRQSAANGPLITERLAQATLNALSARIAILDEYGNIISVNKAWTQFAGESSQSNRQLVEGANFLAICDTSTGDDAEHMGQAAVGVRSMIDTSCELFTLEYPCASEHGLVWFTMRVTSLSHGAHGRVVLSYEDITDRKRAEDETARIEGYNQLLLASTTEGIYGIDMSGKCTFVNNAGSTLLGYTTDQVLGKDMHSLIHHSRHDGSLYPVTDCPIYRAFQKGLPCHIDSEVMWRRDGTPFYASYVSHPVKDADGIVGAVISFTDITERRRIEAEREKLRAEAQERADRDHLTGLLNHRAFFTKLDAEAARSRRENTTLAVVMIDLDGFKYFNDVYGHATGDELLCLVANRLRETCRSYDVVARFGGDEFALLLPGVGETTVEDVEERVKSALGGLCYKFTEPPATIPVSISVGASLYPSTNADRHEVLRHADERLRWSKSGGHTEERAQQLRAETDSRVHGFSMLDALVTAVDNKDRYTRRHSDDVMQYSLMIARQLNLNEADQRIIAVSALLHDVGKIGVPDEILRKPGHLTEEEFEAIKQHPVMGAIMVQAVPGLETTIDTVRHHHERWDGNGYPWGLRGEECPRFARIMAVADAFSAMTTDRPYRSGIGRVKAVEILRNGAGTQWDPECVTAFLTAISEEDAEDLAA